jgi:hypothetical protein
MGAMVITAIDSGLEQLLRVALPLPVDLGDVSFSAPERSWGAQLSRVTVNLFLFAVNRSNQPAHPPAQRPRADGQVERRAPLPNVQLSYLVTAWAGNTTDEHQLLGDVLRCLLRSPVLPPEYLPEPLEGSVQLALADRSGRNPGELWSALDARLKPGFQLDVTAALDSPWAPAAAPVERIEGLVARHGGGATSGAPGAPGAPAPGRTANGAAPQSAVPPVLVRRREGAAVVTEPQPDAEA